MSVHWIHQVPVESGEIILFRAAVPQPCKEEGEEECQDAKQAHLANLQMQQTSKQALLAYIQTNATNEGKGDEELGSEKEAEAVEGDDQSCLTCGQSSREVPYPYIYENSHIWEQQESTQPYIYMYMRIPMYENSRKVCLYENSRKVPILAAAGKYENMRIAGTYPYIN